MPSAKELQHRRTHNLLLIQKLLSSRENASPFTLVLDSLEQSGRPLIRAITKRANVAKTQIIFVAFETLRKPANVDTFIHTFNLSPADLQKRLTQATSNGQRSIIIIDSLHHLLARSDLHIPTFLSSLMSPTVSILATYHIDVPLPCSPSHQPHPLTLLKYLATTMFTVHSLHHVLAQKAARDRAEPEPLFGWGAGAEDVEGVLMGVGANDARGVVIEMEYRRRSGRGVGEWFFLPSPSSRPPPSSAKPQAGNALGIILLEDHPLYALPSSPDHNAEGGEMDSTFSLGLTEKQRRDREGVVLPYFDAQSGEGGGEGGRILYEMGWEDDFDEEEDEI